MGVQNYKTLSNTQLEERHLGASTRTMDVAQPATLYASALTQAVKLARLSPSHSYWDYIPVWLQHQIMKTVHEQAMQPVHAELLVHFHTPTRDAYNLLLTFFSEMGVNLGVFDLDALRPVLQGVNLNAHH